MPGHMIHLLVAKKVYPNAGVDFFVGTLAPDTNAPYISPERSKKDKIHLVGAPDMETALREFASLANNDYLKGFLLHLYVDWKWNTTYLAEFVSKTKESSQEWYPAYDLENRKMTSYAYYSTEWASDLFEQMENWDCSGFAETEFITEEIAKDWILSVKKWLADNILEPSTAFTPDLLEKFATDTAIDFARWFSCAVR